MVFFRQVANLQSQVSQRMQRIMQGTWIGVETWQWDWFCVKCANWSKIDPHEKSKKKRSAKHWIFLRDDTSWRGLLEIICYVRNFQVAIFSCAPYDREWFDHTNEEKFLKGNTSPKTKSKSGRVQSHAIKSDVEKWNDVSQDAGAGEQHGVHLQSRAVEHGGLNSIA